MQKQLILANKLKKQKRQFSSQNSVYTFNLSILLQYIKVMAEYSYLHKDYYLTVSNNEDATLLSIFDYRNLKNIKKYMKNFYFLEDQLYNKSQPLKEYFDSSKQFVDFIRSEKNYQVFFSPYPLINLKWSFVGENYQKQKTTSIFLEEILATQQSQQIINEKILQKNQSNDVANEKIPNKNIEKTHRKKIDDDQISSEFVPNTKKSRQKNKKISLNKSDHQYFNMYMENKMKRQKSFSSEKKSLRSEKTKKINKQMQMKIKKTDEKLNLQKKKKTSSQRIIKSSLKSQQYISFKKIDENISQIILKNGDYYIGGYKDNLYNGHGFYFSVIGGTYEGEWKDGLAEGEGISIDIQKNKLKGIFIKDKRYGMGTNEFLDGQKYQGNFEAQVMSGWGKYTKVDGSYYQGFWQNDQSHGKGKYYCNQDKSIYLGYWENDVKSGKGILTKDGITLLQKWQKGKLIESQKISKKQKQQFEAQFNLKPPE